MCFPLNFSLTLPITHSAQCLQESFVLECELVQEDLLSNDITIEGEYLSEETMKSEWGWTQ